MNLVLFIIVIVISMIVVRIGAIAFQLTGLDWSFAKFQSLSCFTGTGFTTKESELITGNPQRRRIASALIVLGHAGFVSMVATFANSLRNDAFVFGFGFKIPFLVKIFPPRFLPWANLSLAAIAAYLIYILFTHTKAVRRLTGIVRNNMVKREIVKPVTFQELSLLSDGYGISQVDISDKSPLLGKSLIESGLRGKDITILAIERKERVIPNPPAEMKILIKDKLVCFGKFEAIRQEIYEKK